ncbi:MAG: hypothetical protein KF773_11565 [Deltaproteobacteria bacterium]|nr:hypothetical protein [Deltaproteobacteria bacterium]MCW5808057.1 hypothetical protein [Deltaproteobacteria bacterium]
MRTLILATLTLVPAIAAANPSRPLSVTTQACLGDFTALPCPAGSARSGTECRAREAQRGKGAGEHWSGSKRQGPSVFLRDAAETDPAKQRVSFAANYKDHKKHGRVFNFDKDGRLDSWSDMADDTHHGLSVDCRPDGTVAHVAYYSHGKHVGISRSWRESDGTLSYAFDQGTGGGSSRRLDPTPALSRRPDELCRPARCDLSAAPDLSGIPAGSP